MLNLEFLEESHILIPKRKPGMVLLLILYVRNDRSHLGMPIRESPKAFLPSETTDDPFLPIYEV